MSATDWVPVELAAGAKQRTLRAGESLFRTGDPVYGVFAIESGRIQMLRYDIQGRPLVLFTGIQGDLFAEAALFSETYHCDAVAVADATVRIFSKPTLLSLFTRDPTAAQKFTALIARELITARTRLELLNIRSADERVLRHLGLAAGADGRTVNLPGTLKETAEDLGLTPEAFYRVLADLEKRGLIERKDHLIKLLDTT
jgi:CRP-like cAMP-binding protein